MAETPERAPTAYVLTEDDFGRAVDALNEANSRFADGELAETDCRGLTFRGVPIIRFERQSMTVWSDGTQALLPIDLFDVLMGVKHGR